MSFGDHLDELRRRLMLGLIVPVPLMIVLFFFSEWIIDWLRVPVTSALRANGLPEQMQVLSPTEMIMLQMKLSMILALVLSAPWILYQAWKFIEPGLYAHEKRFVHFLMPFSAVMVMAGVALLYYGILPLMLRVLIAFGMIGADGGERNELVAQILKQQPLVRIVQEEEVSTLKLPTSPASSSEATANESPAPQVYLTWPAMNLYVTTINAAGERVLLEAPRSWVKQEYRLSEYINLVLMLMLAVAIAFQMPLVIALLGWMGLASPQWLRKRRRYALLICGVVAVVITPPDALSALLMLAPLYALYELGILLLVIAPASKVAEGRVFSFRRFRKSRTDSADNGGKAAEKSRKSAQMELTVSRKAVRDDPMAQDADGEGDKP